MVSDFNVYQDILRNPLVEPLHRDEGAKADDKSVRAFLVTDESGKFKLRRCADENEAAVFEGRVKRLGGLGVLPRFHGRDGKCLLFDYVEGRDLTEDELPEAIRKLGELVGKINSLPAETFDHVHCFRESLDYLLKQQALGGRLHGRILSRFQELDCRIRVRYAWDFTDFVPSNFRLSDDGKVLVIDEESIEEKFAGFGISKPLMKWFNSGQRKAFFEGYGRALDAAFFDSDYELFAKLFFLVSTACFVGRKGKSPTKSIRKLDELVSSPYRKMTSRLFGWR